MAKNKPKTNTLNLMIVLSILLLVSLCVYYYFFRALESTGQEIADLSNQTDSLLAQQSNLMAMRAIFNSTGAGNNQLESRLVQPDRAIDFISTIENLASFAGLSHDTQAVNTIPLQPPSDHYELLHFNFHTEGSWRDTFYFISLLETLPFNIKINQMNMHDTGDTALESQNSVSLSVGTSTSTSKPVTSKSSVWESTYDFTVVKLK